MTTLERARQFALSLPEATEEPHFYYTSFRIRGKIFATAPPDGEHLHIFVDDEQRIRALAEQPCFLEELLWGKSACGLRVFLPEADPAVIDALLLQAWTRKAPKRLLGGNSRTVPLRDRTRHS
jgi:hypothetical protein